MITAEVLINLNSTLISFVSGNPEATAVNVMPPGNAEPVSLVFVSKKDQLDQALSELPTIIIAHKSLPLPKDSPITFFSTDNIQLAMATVLPLFDGKMNRFNQTEKIHPTAIIHPNAQIGKNVCLGPYVFIGDNVKIGNYATVGAQTVIEEGASVGDHSILHPQVFLGAHCEIGSHCEIHPHTTIGSDGFAFVQTKDGTHKKIPQIGRVTIGNNVEIGANCAIDRAALTETRIGHGSKFDNFCHVAHNVVIGENCVMAAGFIIAGSSIVGNNCMFGGKVAITDHVKVCDKVIVGGNSIITNDVNIAGVYAGYPLEPLRENMKTLASIGNGNLVRMRKELSKIIRHLGLNNE